MPHLWLDTNYYKKGDQTNMKKRSKIEATVLILWGVQIGVVICTIIRFYVGGCS